MATPKLNIQIGEQVRVAAGPFKDQIGTIDEIDTERSRATILVEMFGRPTPADLELSFDVPGGSSGGHGAYPIVLTITNKGLGIATDIQIQTTLPEEVTILGNSAEQGTFDPITGTWDVGNIRDNLSRDLVLNIAVDSDDRVDVIAEVSSVFESDPDSTPGNDNPDEDDRAVAQVDRDGGIGSTTDPDRLRFLQLYGLA